MGGERRLAEAWINDGGGGGGGGLKTRRGSGADVLLLQKIKHRGPGRTLQGRSLAEEDWDAA